MSMRASMKNLMATAAVAAAFVLGVAGTASANIIANGDFEAGNTGFASDYLYCNTMNCLQDGTVGHTGGQGMYGVGTDASFFHPAFTSAPDHTPTGPGNMMVVNGADSGSLRVWYESLGLTPNTQYTFSAYAMNVYPSNPATLSFTIGGQFLGTLTPTGSGTWNLFTATFTTGAAPPDTNNVIDIDIHYEGNDFALDDLSLELAAVPDGGLTIALLGMALTGVGLMRRKIS